jgi:3-isopropylmalate/(R)-2-methylmalate dehydratase small subunit
MTDLVYAGRVWKFGDNISTDLMMPGESLFKAKTPQERALYCMQANRPGWSRQVRPGDILVAGKNFGCGSSRPATENLKSLGISCVVAESISRIFFRMSVNHGFPLLICPGATGLCEEGDQIRVDIGTGIVQNERTGASIEGEAMPPDSPPMEILQAGGMVQYLARFLKDGVMSGSSRR